MTSSESADALEEKFYCRITIHAVSEESIRHIANEMRLPEDLIDIRIVPNGPGFAIHIEARWTSEELRRFSLDFEIFRDLGLLRDHLTGSLGASNVSVRHH